MYLQDLKAGTPPVEITSGKEFLYSGEIYQNKLYITTNEDAPRSRVLVVDAANPKHEYWKEIVPQSDAVLQNTAIVGGKLCDQYEKNGSFLLKLFPMDSKIIDDIPLPAIWSVSGHRG